MSTTTNRAIGAGLAILAVAIGGVATWRHQHPGAQVADLAGVPPAIPRLDPKKTLLSKPAEASGEEQKPRPEDQAALVAPHFDVARVEPGGDAIVAGSGIPNAKVSLLAGAKVLAEAQADANGQFVLLPPPLAPGEQTLTLRQSPVGGPVVESTQKLVVSVPNGGRGHVVIALAEPGKPTRMLSPPSPSDASPPASPAIVATAPKSIPAPLPTRLVVQSKTAGNGDGFEATGVAPPGTPIHLSLNNSHLADVVAGPDGKWSVVIRKGLSGGHYVVRADATMPGNQAAGRIEIPFDVGSAAATSVSPADSREITTSGIDVADGARPDAAQGAKASDPNDGAKARMSASADPAVAIIEAIETRKVSGGDNLWNISRERLGDATRFSQIYAANASQIRDPNLIYPGQVFVLPRK